MDSTSFCVFEQAIHRSSHWNRFVNLNNATRHLLLFQLFLDINCTNLPSDTVGQKRLVDWACTGMQTHSSSWSFTQFSELPGFFAVLGNEQLKFPEQLSVAKPLNPELNQKYWVFQGSAEKGDRGHGNKRGLNNKPIFKSKRIYCFTSAPCSVLGF